MCVIFKIYSKILKKSTSLIPFLKAFLPWSAELILFCPEFKENCSVDFQPQAQALLQSLKLIQSYSCNPHLRGGVMRGGGRLGVWVHGRRVATLPLRIYFFIPPRFCGAVAAAQTYLDDWRFLTESLSISQHPPLLELPGVAILTCFDETGWGRWLCYTGRGSALAQRRVSLHFTDSGTPPWPVHCCQVLIPTILLETESRGQLRLPSPRSLGVTGLQHNALGLIESNCLNKNFNEHNIKTNKTISGEVLSG